MEANIVIAIIGAVIAILTYFAGARKSSNEEVAEQARFEGIVTTKLDQLLHDFKELKKSLSEKTSNLYGEINRQIKEHEERYHHD